MAWLCEGQLGRDKQKFGLTNLLMKVAVTGTSPQLIPAADNAPVVRISMCLLGFTFLGGL